MLRQGRKQGKKKNVFLVIFWEGFYLFLEKPKIKVMDWMMRMNNFFLRIKCEWNLNEVVSLLRIKLITFYLFYSIAFGIHTHTHTYIGKWLCSLLIKCYLRWWVLAICSFSYRCGLCNICLSPIFVLANTWNLFIGSGLSEWWNWYWNEHFNLLRTHKLVAKNN